MLSIGIDIGGTRIKGVLMSHEGHVIYKDQIDTNASSGGGHVLASVLDLIETIRSQAPDGQLISGVGLGTPGFVDSNGIIAGGAENLPGWEGTPLCSSIEERFGLTARAGNDVTVAAWGEYCFGGRDDLKNMVFIALGTGIGGGLILNGQLYEGTGGMAAEIGHICVDTGPDALQCNCGQRGCVERYASGVGLVDMALRIGRTYTPSVSSTLHQLILNQPEILTAEDVYRYVSRGDSLAILIHEAFCAKLARLCGILINTLAPEAIIMGGGVLNAGDIIPEKVKELTARYAWPQMYQRVRFERSQLGSWCGAIGAAALMIPSSAGR
jgi:glucokinase